MKKIKNLKMRIQDTRTGVIYDGENFANTLEDALESIAIDILVQEGNMKDKWVTLPYCNKKRNIKEHEKARKEIIKTRLILREYYKSL